MLNVMVVLGTRPEIIKLNSVIKELKKYPERWNVRICVVGQHREMLRPLLKLFDIRPDYDLDIMEKNQSLEHITTTVILKFKEIFKTEKIDLLIVQGDTSTSMAASLEAYYYKILVAHVEAGLRTGNIYEPYPEEINRKIIDSISRFCFAPTQQAKENLLKEGIENSKIAVTGNTGIDTFLEISSKKADLTTLPLQNIPFDEKSIVLVTAHRRENFGVPLKNICHALKEIAERHSNDAHIVYPVHMNPNVQKSVHSILGDIENITLMKPLEYENFVHLMKHSFLILTDSGGIQEEAPSIHVPVLILRKITERPEAVSIGAAKIIGTDVDKIIAETTELLENIKIYRKMANTENPYGDGTSGKQIVEKLLEEFKK